MYTIKIFDEDFRLIIETNAGDAHIEASDKLNRFVTEITDETPAWMETHIGLYLNGELIESKHFTGNLDI